MSYNRTAYFGQARSAAAASGSGAGSSPPPPQTSHNRTLNNYNNGHQPNFAHGAYRGSGGRSRGGGRPRSVFEGHSGSAAASAPGFAGPQDDMTMEQETSGIHGTLEGYLHVQHVAPENDARFAKWLPNKLYGKVKIKQMQRHGETLMLQMENFSQACQATRCDGYIFSEQKIEIKCAPPVLPPDVATLITEVLASRFDASSNSLNLSSIGKEAALGARGIKHLSKANAWILLSQVGVNCPQVTTISFDSNDVRSTHPFTCLSDYAPNVQNISLKNNNISHYDQLDGLAGLAHLREIMLSGNPIRDQAERKRGLSDYKKEVVKRFPSIAYLDGEDIAAIRKLIPTSQLRGGGQLDGSVGGIQPTRGWFDQDSSQAVVDDFVTQYWKLYDENRQQLLPVYDENAIFSLSTGFPPTGSKGGNARRHRDKAETMYHKYTRHGTAQPTNIIYPATAIIQALKSIPNSLHADRQSWYVDAWQQTTDPPTLFVNVTGVFAEVLDGNYTKRSFDRRFVLLPATPGSPAQLAGWPVSIINDHLHVRPHVPMTREGQVVAGRSIGMSPSTSPQLNPVGDMPAALTSFQFPPNITPPQQQMTQEFSLHTRLTLEFAFQCLAGVQFDGAKAVEAFEMTKAAGTIPAIAWLPS